MQTFVDSVPDSIDWHEPGKHKLTAGSKSTVSRHIRYIFDSFLEISRSFLIQNQHVFTHQSLKKTLHILLLMSLWFNLLCNTWSYSHGLIQSVWMTFLKILLNHSKIKLILTHFSYSTNVRVIRVTDYNIRSERVLPPFASASTLS